MFGDVIGSLLDGLCKEVRLPLISLIYDEHKADVVSTSPDLGSDSSDARCASLETGSQASCRDYATAPEMDSVHDLLKRILNTPHTHEVQSSSSKKNSQRPARCFHTRNADLRKLRKEKQEMMGGDMPQRCALLHVKGA